MKKKQQISQASFSWLPIFRLMWLWHEIFLLGAQLKISCTDRAFHSSLYKMCLFMRRKSDVSKYLLVHGMLLLQSTLAWGFKWTVIFLLMLLEAEKSKVRESMTEGLVCHSNTEWKNKRACSKDSKKEPEFTLPTNSFLWSWLYFHYEDKVPDIYHFLSYPSQHCYIVV